MATWIFFNDLAIDIDLVKSFHVGSEKYCDPLKFIKFNYIDGSELSWNFYSYEEAQKVFTSLQEKIGVNTLLNKTLKLQKLKNNKFKHLQEKPATDFTALFAQDTEEEFFVNGLPLHTPPPESYTIMRY
jgi:hypothetical protein